MGLDVEVPTREQDLETVEDAISEATTAGRRRVARRALDRLLDPPPERDRYVVLAEARKVLGEMAAERYSSAYSASAAAGKSGMAYMALNRAEDAVFNALNILTHHCDDERAAAALRDV